MNPVKAALDLALMPARLGLRLAQRVAGGVLPGGRPEPEPPTARSYAEPAPRPRPRPRPAAAPSAPSEPEPGGGGPGLFEPTHVESEEELVAEFADPGAEDGAGPELRVEEPWPGYAKMTAGEIRDRLGAADAALAAVVELYERTHRKRSTVIAAASARL
jgi:hypothetical protein